MYEENEEPEEGETVTLTDEEGNEHEFEIIQVLKVDDKDYAILIPVDVAGADEEGAVILRVEDENGEAVLVEIDDDEEFERVCEAWDEMEAEDSLEEDPEDESR